MNCPVCNSAQLVMSERQGVEIDYCPQCRGVWLDRGELDKILEKAAKETAAPQALSIQSGQMGYGGYPSDHHRDHHRRKSIWKELFD